MRGLISLSAMAIVLGQHVRVGNEDNLWGPDKKRRTSVQQVEGAVRICEEFGRKVATAEEAREIMKVGVWYNSIEETLMNLGLPPNRRDGDKGFLVWADGRQEDGRQGRRRLAPDGLLHGAARRREGRDGGAWPRRRPSRRHKRRAGRGGAPEAPPRSLAADLSERSALALAGRAARNFEIYGDDPEALAAFYRELLGWRIEKRRGRRLLAHRDRRRRGAA